MLNFSPSLAFQLHRNFVNNLKIYLHVLNRLVLASAGVLGDLNKEEDTFLLIGESIGMYSCVE